MLHDQIKEDGSLKEPNEQKWPHSITSVQNSSTEIDKLTNRYSEAFEGIGKNKGLRTTLEKVRAVEEFKQPESKEAM